MARPASCNVQAIAAFRASGGSVDAEFQRQTLAPPAHPNAKVEICAADPGRRAIPDVAPEARGRRCHPEQRRLRGLPPHRQPVAAPAHVHVLRPRRLLRQLAQPARHRPLPSQRSSDHSVLRARRGLVVLLSRRARLPGRRTLVLPAMSQTLATALPVDHGDIAPGSCRPRVAHRAAELGVGVRQLSVGAVVRASGRGAWIGTARLGDRVFLGEGTLVPAAMELPSDVVAVGRPARVIRTVSDADLDRLRELRDGDLSLPAHTAALSPSPVS